MLEELQPLSLVDAARQLGVTPFEVVRLLVAAGEVPDGPLRVDGALLGELRKLGGIQDTWWTGVDLPDDEDPRLQRVRAGVKLLLDRKHIGEGAATRLDNVSRGLAFEDQDLLRFAFFALAEDGVVRLMPSRVAQTVCILPAAEKVARALVDGKQVPSALSAMLAG
jgi:hypothetical protein